MLAGVAAPAGHAQETDLGLARYEFVNHSGLAGHHQPIAARFVPGEQPCPPKR